jgi:hypothetical protein
VEKIQQYNKQYYWDNQEKIKLNGEKWDKTMRQRRKRETQITEKLTKKRSSNGKNRERHVSVVANTPLAGKAAHMKRQRHITHVSAHNDLVQKLNDKFGEEDWTISTLEMRELLLE